MNNKKDDNVIKKRVKRAPTKNSSNFIDSSNETKTHKKTPILTDFFKKSETQSSLDNVENDAREVEKAENNDRNVLNLDNIEEKEVFFNNEDSDAEFENDLTQDLAEISIDVENNVQDDKKTETDQQAYKLLIKPYRLQRIYCDTFNPNILQLSTAQTLSCIVSDLMNEFINSFISSLIETSQYNIRFGQGKTLNIREQDLNDFIANITQHPFNILPKLLTLSENQSQ